MRFIGNVFATIVGLFLFFGIMFVGFFILGVLISGNPEDAKKTNVKDNSVIVLNLDQITQDYAPKVVVSDFPMFNQEKHNGLVDVLKAIDIAKTDHKIKGISLENPRMSLGTSQIKALRDKLIDFQKSGKFVVSYADNYSQAQYYLASIADTIYINPVGSLDFKGLDSEVLFFKDFQDKYGIKAEVIRHGKYKSAAEPFLQNQMSYENRLQIQELLCSIWLTLVSDISESRNITIDSLDVIARELRARTPQLAKNKGLIDKIAYKDDFQNGIKKALKINMNEDYNTIDISDYATNIGISSKVRKIGDKIAVIYAQGQIIDGEGNAKEIGEGYVTKSLQEATKNKNIKAVVIRVNSPGGSALASEIIWREIERTKRKKPVVVSMGNVAASGGYYISCSADKIFAEPTTITGSIGVFGVIPNIQEFANDKGIYSDIVSTHSDSTYYSALQPMSERFREITTESVENIYDVFLTRVADGRAMTKNQVDEIAQGRIWSGIEAQRLGLVDEIGSLDDAIDYAAELSEIENYNIQSFPVFKKTLENYFTSNSPFPIKSYKEIIKEEIGENNYQILEQIRSVNSQKGILTMMPYQINIK